MDREELIDAFVQANQEGNVGMWKSCRIAWELFDKFGAYSQDTVSVLSVACNLGYDAIYNRRNAWQEFITLYPDDTEQAYVSVRDLSPSHFYRLHRLRENSVDITNNQAILYLLSAREYGWSSGKLCEVVQGNHDKDKEKTYIRRISRFSRSLDTLISESDKMGLLGLPDNLVKDACTLKRNIEEWLNTKGQTNEHN